MSVIYAIRHGQASFGTANYDRLSDLGIRQAAILGRHFDRIGLRFDAVYQGTLVRQRHTAEAAMAQMNEGPAVPVVTMPALDEYNATRVWKHYIPQILSEEPALRAELDAVFADQRAFQRLFSRVMLRWIDRPEDAGGLPRWSDFRAGVSGGLAEIMGRHPSGSRIALFTSSGTIAAMAGHALELSDRRTMSLSYQILNASVTRLRWGSGGIGLAGLNDVAHLELEREAALLTYR